VRLFNADGSELNADFFVERDGDRLAVILESYSGGDHSRPPRNPEYRKALRLMIGRLQGLSATLVDALIDSRDTQRAETPESERRLIEAPIPLASEVGPDRIYTLLTSGQRRLAVSPRATGPGNGTRRIRLRLAVPGYESYDSARLERALAIVDGGGEYRSADEPDPGRTYDEGSVTQVKVNRYERDPRAREACLAHYGYRCQACDLDFGDIYGPLGEGFIHVHHTKELSTVGPGYRVDPVDDLRPLCPNCHAMVHRSSPAMPVEELRRLVRARS
jgi:5-methylcytosine-specific restriction protein A